MNPARFRLARELAGLTQTDLAGRLGVGQPAIAHIENGRLEPSRALAEGIARETGLTVEFLDRDDLPDFPLGSLLLYRSKAGVAAKEETRVRRHAQLLTEFTMRLWERVSPLPVRLPQLRDTPPVEAAHLTRSALGLSPDTPILDLVRVIERAGVLVLALPTARDPIDAFSAWVDDGQVPCMVLLADSPGDRQRWSIAHELGHLVMHRSMRGSSGIAENEAERFAAELLTPLDVMAEEIVKPVTLFSLRSLKGKWRVSMRSLVNRAFEVEAISANQRKYLFIKLNQEFGGRTEPQAFLPERPRAVRQLVEMVYGNPLDWSKVARDLGVGESLAMEYLEGYAHRGEPAKLVQFPVRNR